MPATITPWTLGAWLALAVATGAQEEVVGPQGQDLLLGFNFNYTYARASAPDSSQNETEKLAGRVGLSWFESRTHELGVELVPSLFRNEGSPDTSDYYLGALYSYNHWSNPRTNLYAGPQIGFLYQKLSGASNETALSWGLHAGMRYWLSSDVSVVVEPRWTRTNLDEAFGGDSTTLDIFLGVSFIL